MYMNLGQGDLFGRTKITGGLKVNGIDLPNTRSQSPCWLPDPPATPNAPGPLSRGHSACPGPPRHQIGSQFSA